ncbi:441_t:CDS:1, partial [Gigaspora rosea]
MSATLNITSISQCVVLGVNYRKATFPKRKRKPNYYKYMCWYSRRPKIIDPDEYVNLYKRCWNSSPKNRPQVNELMILSAT